MKTAEQNERDARRNDIFDYLDTLNIPVNVKLYRLIDDYGKAECKALVAELKERLRPLL